jgi:PHD/YefM family antitoxin component YafN of YafNO toxin-antitoxin module
MVKKKDKKVKQTNTLKKKRVNFTGLLVIMIILGGVGWYFTNNKNLFKSKESGIEQISGKKDKELRQFIEKNKEDLFSPDANVEIKDIVKEDGLYKIMLNISGDETPFYLTKNNKLVLQVVSLDKITKGKMSILEGVDIKRGKVVINNKIKDSIKKIVENYLVNKKTTVEIKEIKEEDDLIKVEVSVQGESQPLYFTKSGKRVALSVISLDEYKKAIASQREARKNQREARKKAATVKEENKKDKPVVDIFVMSYCPYGTQIEKGIIPVLRLLKDKIEAKIRFVDYAMHDKKEIDENIRQYCIQKNTPEKVLDYLECFLEKGESANCVKKVGVNVDKLAQCTKETDTKFKISENYKDKSTWQGRFPGFDIDKDDNKKYGVEGSPTLIINGQKIQPAGRDAQSLLNAICSGFKNQPEECKKELSKEQPSAGFGTGTSKSSGGGCGQ